MKRGTQHSYEKEEKIDSVPTQVSPICRLFPLIPHVLKCLAPPISFSPVASCDFFGGMSGAKKEGKMRIRAFPVSFCRAGEVGITQANVYGMGRCSN